jgi:predicted P-loop ATPase
MKFTIAIGNSRKDKIWKNQDITWESFTKRVSQTYRTSELVNEYKKLSKAQQDAIKDIGGFVAGQLREGRRKNGFVEYRSMLTLDMDYALQDIWDQIELFYDFTCCIYSTHKHTYEKPRLRLIIPLARTVTADEYTAVSRRLAADIGIDQFDDTTYEPVRLMYWPSTSADGEFVFKEQQGVLLDPDKLLARYADWRDSSSWPVSSRQGLVVKKSIAKQADPLEKEGIIGTFCRTYSIQDVMEKFLADVYKPSIVPDRYDYIAGESTAGVVIYDEKFSFSHHATDPASGKLCNAFDLVRLHKFRDLDTDVPEGTLPSKRPSYKAMTEFCTKDEVVKGQVVKERIGQVAEDFNVTDDKWQEKLDVNKNGQVVNSLKNLILILQNDELLKHIVFNQFSDGMEIIGEVPWKHPSKFWRDADDAQLMSYVDSHYGTFSKQNYITAVAKVTDDRSYHPIRQYLESLPVWDGIERIDPLLIDYLGAADSEYVRAVTRKVLCAAVARVLRPGCKYDTILVLNGPQGIGKSTLISKLGGEWFSDSLQLSDTHDKTAAEKLQGYWIFEIGELAGLRKAEIETLRSFLSRQNDIYRASFGRRPTPHLRQCVFIGTTNAESGYLRDTTGNRRFWPVKVIGHSRKRAWMLSEEEILQIWAESLAKYQSGETLYLDEKLSEAAEAEQSEAMEADEREALVQEYLERLLPDNWNTLDLYERRNYLNGNEFGGAGVKGTVRRDRVCVMEIWCECFGKEQANLKRLDGNEIRTIMSKLKNWKKHESKIRFPLYGVLQGYLRVNNE